MKNEKRQGRLILLCGPSGVGKTPLKKAFIRFYPELYQEMVPLVLINSRQPRPGEIDGIDYFFRTPEQIRSLSSSEQYLFIKVHNDFQALDLHSLFPLLDERDVIFEGNTVIGRVFQTDPRLMKISKLSIFLSPLSMKEILELKAKGENFLREILGKIMRQKLLRRTKNLKLNLSLETINDIKKRADDAYSEIKEAHHFEHIIPLHDGEDSINWYAFPNPVGEAKEALSAFVSIIENEIPPLVEHWDEF
jgi:guanylate kinase